MPNLSVVIKEEIIRLSRKEIKASIAPLQKSNVVLKKTVAELKKQLSVLENSNKKLLKTSSATTANLPKVAPVEMGKARFTGKSVKTLREKLGASQDNFAKVLGVSSQSVYLMEHKTGRLRLRTGTLEKLVAVKAMGKKEFAKRLEELLG